MDNYGHYTGHAHDHPRISPLLRRPGKTEKRTEHLNAMPRLRSSRQYLMLNRDLLGTAALVTACYGASAVLKFKSKQAENQCEKE